MKFTFVLLATLSVALLVERVSAGSGGHGSSGHFSHSGGSFFTKKDLVFDDKKFSHGDPSFFSRSKVVVPKKRFSFYGKHDGIFFGKKHDDFHHKKLPFKAGDFFYDGSDYHYCYEDVYGIYYYLHGYRYYIYIDSFPKFWEKYDDGFFVDKIPLFYYYWNGGKFTKRFYSVSGKKGW